MKNGVIKFNTNTGEKEQLYTDIDYGKALSIVMNLRALNDGYAYYLGTI
ncbi:hypothetical protein [Priestia flexa]|nr:hypothetical protein [Priestia flexa]